MNYINLLASALISLVFCPFLQAKSLSKDSLNFCYTQKREDLSTEVALIGKYKNFFKDEGLILNPIKSTDLPLPEGVSFQKDLNINLATAEKKIYIPTMYLNYNLNMFSTLVDEKDCDIISTSLEYALFTKKSKEVSLLAMYVYGGKYDTHIISLKDSSVNSLKDLVGKKIRLGITATYLAFKNAMNKRGLRADQVEIIHTKVEETEAGLDQGNYAAAIVYNPTMALLLATGKYKIIYKNLYSEFSPSGTIPNSALFVKNNFLKNNKIKIEKFLRGYLKSEAFLKKNPEELVYGTEPYYGKNPYGFFSPLVIEKSASAFAIPSIFIFANGYKNEETTKEIMLTEIKNFEIENFKAGIINQKFYYDSLANRK